MSIEEYVQKSREEMRKKFGKVEMKTDCRYYAETMRREFDCSILVLSGDRERLQCECGVCYFYRP